MLTSGYAAKILFFVLENVPSLSEGATYANRQG